MHFHFELDPFLLALRHNIRRRPQRPKTTTTLPAEKKEEFLNPFRFICSICAIAIVLC